MRLDYTLCTRESLTLAEVSSRSRNWTLFISAFNDSERVTKVFEQCGATRKHWLVQPEYAYTNKELPRLPETYAPTTPNEAEFWQFYFERSGINPQRETLCVDITGFMRPHLMFLVATLFRRGVSEFFALYTDPLTYAKRDNTTFSKGPIESVRQVAGFEGVHTPTAAADVLVIGMGYDDELIRRVSEAKENARKVQLFGFPSLSADMYQESVLRASKAAEAIGATAHADILFAPANDPFVTAQVLSQRLGAEQMAGTLGNRYLAPLGTKPQALGFSLYYEAECRQTATSIVFPFASGYERETTHGIARTWLYQVRLPEP